MICQRHTMLIGLHQIFLISIQVLIHRMYYFYPEITFSGEEGSQVMWYAGYEGSAFTWSEDTMFYFPQDIDIYMKKSPRFWCDLDRIRKCN